MARTKPIKHPPKAHSHTQKFTQPSVDSSVVKPTSWWKLSTGLFLILLGIGLIATPFLLKQFIENHALSTDFQTEPVKVNLATFAASAGEMPTRINIPVLDIDLPVKPSPIKNGFWVVWEDAAGFGEGSAPPGQVGNTVIFAHARKGLFLPLKNAREGMRITLSTNSQNYTYQISEIKTVLPYELEVIAPTKDQTLTLYTCSGFLDKKRLIVVAKPVT